MPHHASTKTLGKTIDALYQQRTARLELQKEIDRIKAEEAKLTEIIFNMMDNGDVTKSAGKMASASISNSEYPIVNDWELFYKFIARTSQFHLLQRRVADAAVKEIIHTSGEEESVPGVKLHFRRKLNLGKVSN